ncbi:MAG TPA: hypothetical protein VGW10_01335 [Solirubrobacteraceae bacterium]|nr:hypothetical protein [Solirubrobacteraceae bacterium]
MARATLRTLLPLLALAGAFAVLVQASGHNQSSHYALVRALDDGTARIDRWHTSTVDKAYFEGHYYSVKAPGLAFASLPWYAATDAVGLVERAESAGERVTREEEGARGNPEIVEQTPVVWLLTFWAVVLPALALLVLVRSVAERYAPGYGTAAAVAAGTGTLLLPYSTMYYSHVPAAALAFGAFALLLRERPLLAGLAGGLAVLVEYPAAFIVLVLAIWARSPRFVLGAFVGGLPLPLYNLWAFGSVTHMSYDDVVGFEGQEEGLFGISLPDPATAFELLFEPTGLLVLTPVVAAAAWGLWRLRSWVLIAIVAVALLYNAAYYLPFGGDTPGPRFLVGALPFLAVGLAVALRERTTITLGLAAASAVGMLVATIAEPQIVNQDTGRWHDLLADGDLQYTLAGAAGAGHGWLGILPFLALVALAIVLAARTLPAVSGGAAVALAVVGAWALVAGVAGDAVFVTLAGAVAGAAAVVIAARSAGRSRSPAPCRRSTGRSRTRPRS